MKMIARTFACLALVLASPSGAQELPPDNVPGVDNPSVSQSNIHRTICRPGWSKTQRPPVSYTNALKRKLMDEAGIPWSHVGDYELDHRKAIEDGGDPRDPGNLWLQPWKGPRNARMKDKLETALHRDICVGRITLDAGRIILGGDFWKEYDRRFGKAKAARR